MPVPVASDLVVEGAETTVDRERSCSVEETERPSRGGKMPLGPFISSEKVSSSSSGTSL